MCKASLTSYERLGLVRREWDRAVLGTAALGARGWSTWAVHAGRRTGHGRHRRWERRAGRPERGGRARRRAVLSAGQGHPWGQGHKAAQKVAEEAQWRLWWRRRRRRRGRRRWRWRWRRRRRRHTRRSPWRQRARRAAPMSTHDASHGLLSSFVNGAAPLVRRRRRGRLWCPSSYRYSRRARDGARCRPRRRRARRHRRRGVHRSARGRGRTRDAATPEAHLWGARGGRRGERVHARQLIRGTPRTARGAVVSACMQGSSSEAINVPGECEGRRRAVAGWRSQGAIDGRASLCHRAPESAALATALAARGR